MAKKIDHLSEIKAGCAARLRIARKITGLSQTKFAERANIRSNTYNQYEKAERLPDLPSAIRLCETYALTLDWIFRGTAGGLNYDYILKLKGFGVHTDPDT